MIGIQEAGLVVEDGTGDGHGSSGSPVARAPGGKVVDERSDPYSARDNTEENRGERLRRVIKEEKAIEGIVRARSWGLVRDRCGGGFGVGGAGWESMMNRWEDSGSANVSATISEIATELGYERRAEVARSLLPT